MSDGPTITDDEVTALLLRYSEHTDSPEWKLVTAFVRLHTCWHCSAALLIDVHQHCEDCPEYDEDFEPESGDNGSNGGAEPGASH
jgi:hypothetical protein